jgi:N-acetyl-gamma-glutamyl-phosphate reductase
MQQEMEKVAGAPVGITFAPHLLPVSRGMLETIYLRLGEGAGPAAVEEAYGEDYSGEPFVKVLPRGTLPSLREAAGTNLCRIGFTDDPQGGRLIVVSVIDNLVKGAAGQAVQNLNLMLGLPETAGLEIPGLYP